MTDPTPNPHRIPARRRAKGRTIPGWFAMTPPPTEQQILALTSLVRRHNSPEDSERILTSLLAEPKPFRQSDAYFADLQVRRDRRARKKAERLAAEAQAQAAEHLEEQEEAA